jgi:Ca-activated chloride channel family protein
MSFAWPWMFICLPLPLAVWFFFKPSSESQQAPIFMPASKHWPKADQNAIETDSNSSALPKMLLSLLWIFLVFAASRPQWVGEPISIPAEGHDLMLAVDLSGSMSTEDMIYQGRQMNRLNAVKLVLKEFLQERQGDRIGLVVFGDGAYTYTPVTHDLDSVSILLMDAQVEMAGQNTAIGDAIAHSVDLLKDRPEPSRILILLTDGQNTAGNIEPLPAAQLAAKHKVKIYTVGIGADEMQRRGFMGIFNQTVNPSRDLDEATLKSIAQQTQGLYFRAKSPEQLQSIYEKINELEPIEQDERFIKPTKELFYQPLTAALLLLLALLLHQLLRNGAFASIQQWLSANTSNKRKTQGEGQ